MSKIGPENAKLVELPLSGDYSSNFDRPWRNFMMRSRRQLITAGATAGAVAVLLPALQKATLAAQVTGATTANVADFVTVMAPSDTSFASRIDNLFPGLSNDPIFQKIQAHTVLITNVSGRPISAFSTCWNISTPTGGYSGTLIHGFHPTDMRPRLKHFGLTGNKTRFTGKIPALKADTTRLVSPYFSWSPNYYRSNPQPQWKKILLAKEARKFFFYELAKATSVTVTVDSLIAAETKLIGSDQAHLARVFRISRNAEHDAAVAVLRLIEQGASRDKVESFLVKQGNQYPTSKADVFTNPIYCRVRQRQATVLLRRFRHGTPNQFARTLAYLKSQPKTTIRGAALS